MNNPEREMKNLKSLYEARKKGVTPPPVYRNLGEQLLDVMSMTRKDANSSKASDRFSQVVNAAAGASTGIDYEGGFLVETDKAKDIITTAIETGAFSSRCTRQPISAMADSYFYATADDRDRSTRSGLSVYWKSEAEELESSGKVELDENEIRVEDMYGLLYVTNRMLRDAAALAEFANRELQKEFSIAFDKSVSEGSGVGQCLGIMNSEMLVTVAAQSGQGARTIVSENVVNMMGRFGGDIMQAAWFVDKDSLPQLLTACANSTFYTPGNITAPFGSIFGRPIVPAEQCKTLGSKGDIILADWSQYLLVTKGTEVAESIHVRFLEDEKAFRFVVRLNGQPMHGTPIVPMNGSNSQSPFVMLEDRV